MQQTYATINANWLIWCVSTGETFTMVGSRKINKLDMETEFFPIFHGSFDDFVSPVAYSITGSLRGFIVATGKTELQALVTLLHAFQQEEQAENDEREKTVERTKELKKIRKAHKKAVKQANEGKFDAIKCSEDCIYCSDSNGFYEDWDYYDTSWHDGAEE